MTASVSYRGLCQYCNESPYCTFPRDPQHPIRHCDEFCWSPRCDERSGMMEQSSGQRLVAQQTIAAAQEYKGLCTICDHRVGCTFPRSTEQVVRCCDECC